MIWAFKLFYQIIISIKILALSGIRRPIINFKILDGSKYIQGKPKSNLSVGSQVQNQVHTSPFTSWIVLLLIIGTTADDTDEELVTSLLVSTKPDICSSPIITRIQSLYPLFSGCSLLQYLGDFVRLRQSGSSLLEARFRVRQILYKQKDYVKDAGQPPCVTNAIK